MADIQTTEDDVKRKHTGVPPALVEDVQQNPEALRPVARSMAAINLHNLFVRMQEPATTNKDRMEFQSLLHKLGGLEIKDAATAAPGAGFSITINLPQVGATPGATIEAKAETRQIEPAEEPTGE